MREGGTPKADESTDKLRECDSDKGGGGSKILEILWTSFKYGPSFPSKNLMLTRNGSFSCPPVNRPIITFTTGL